MTIGPFSHLRPGSACRRRRRDRQLRRGQEQPRSARGVKQHHMSYLGDAEIGGGHERRRRHDHRELGRPRKNRTASAPNAFLGVDTMLVAPVDGRRGREDRRRRRRHEGRPARQARGRRAGPDPRAARQAAEPAAKPESSRPLRGGLSVSSRSARSCPGPPDAPRGLLRRGRDRPRLGPAQPDRPARRGGQRRRPGASAACSTIPAGSSPSRSSG